MITVGGHTYNQHVPEPVGDSNLAEPATIDHLFNPKTGQEETEQEYEDRMLSDSQLLQETFKNELGHTTIYFAYPYGAYNATFIKILHETGFRYMFTTQTGVNGINDEPASLFRIDAGATWIATKKIPSLILKAAYSLIFRKAIPVISPDMEGMMCSGEPGNRSLAQKSMVHRQHQSQ